MYGKLKIPCSAKWMVFPKNGILTAAINAIEVKRPK
jgi:hypothetical protein